MSAMTMTEKILARAAGRPAVEPGDNVWVQADVLMTHDVCGPGTIGIFRREFGPEARVWDRERVVLIPDHYIFTQDDKGKPAVNLHDEQSTPSVSEQRLDDFAAAIWAVYDLHRIWHSLGPRVAPLRQAATPGRNDPCWCGSGKKFKKCHGA